MSATGDLLRGLAQLLEDAGVAVYQPTSGYLSTDTAVTFKALPTSPDRGVALTVYSATDLVTVPATRYRFQLYFRGVRNNTLDVDDLGDAAAVVLHDLKDVQLGTVHAVQILRVSSMPMGVDASGRAERSDNYVIDCDLPATVNRPG